ncbi:MAG: hypothetical protein IKZ04_07050, partial [Spirochaetaceae bacterium]|nr:hypothetical protein [Spirochaetaceae bacterium]
WEYMALDGWDLSSYAGGNSNALEGLNKLGREGWEPVDDFYVSTSINDTSKRVYKRIRRDPPSR